MRITALAVVALVSLASAAEPAARPATYPKGLPSSPDYFPIAVWCQSTRNAPKYKEVGIDLYLALWQGPTEQQLAELEKAGMPVICDQNEFAMKNLDRKIIVGWMHGDEPDNAQPIKGEKGWGPPIQPAKIIEDYGRIRKNDPDRPIMLNLGQGVAWDGWYGRGVRTNHPEDYAEYVKGSDIVSFDIYPAVHDKKEIAGNLWYVPKGVDRLRKWTDDKKPVWTCIETTRISNVDRKPTPQEVRTEVWMALVHGARGLVYFAHEFKPKFIEAGLLADKDIAAGVAETNKQVRELAPVLNSPPMENPPTVRSSAEDAPIDIMARKVGDATYIFAVAMRNTPAKATFTVPGAAGKTTVEVLNENRSVGLTDGQFTDDFKGYEVHLYRIGAGK